MPKLYMISKNKTRTLIEESKDLDYLKFTGSAYNEFIVNLRDIGSLESWIDRIKNNYIEHYVIEFENGDLNYCEPYIPKRIIR